MGNKSTNCYLSGLSSNFKPQKIKKEQTIISLSPGLITDKMREIVKYLNACEIPEEIQTIPIKNI